MKGRESMERNICVFQDFLTQAHRERIDAAARAAKMHVRYFATGQFEEAKEHLQHCEVLYAQSPQLLRAAPPTLRWYCTSSAGVDLYCRNDGIFANPDCLLSNSNTYGVTIAEHVVMVALMLLRRMPDYLDSIQNHIWAPPLPVRSIRGCEVTILGTGDIGCHVAQRMRSMGAAKIIGLSRSGKSREAVYDALYPIGDLDAVLCETELLVMALPDTAQTRGMLDRRRIALLPRQALVINVGRGTAIEQEALADALNEGRLSGAALDVAVPEPLPADNPLWTAKNLILTPHISGNMTLGYTCDANVEMFCTDLANYAAGRPLVHLVDRARGY